MKHFKNLKFLGLALLLAFIFMFSKCPDEISDTSKSSDHDSTVLDTPKSTTAATRDTSARFAPKPPSDNRWIRIKFQRNKFNELYTLPGFNKMKFIPIQAGASDQIRLYVCALNVSGDVIGACAFLRENGHSNNPPNRPKDLPGWVMTKVQYEDVFGQNLPTLDLYLEPVEDDATATGKKLLLIGGVTYRVFHGSTGTQLYLNPSPPGFLE